MRPLLGILYWIALVAVVIILARFCAETLRYLFYLRIPILFGLLVFVLPFIAVYPARSLLKNLFVLRRWWQIALVTFAALMAGRAAIIVANVVLENAHDRFRVGEWPEIPGVWQWALVLVLALPTAGYAIALSVDLSGKGRFWGVVSGVLPAVLLIVLGANQWVEAAIEKVLLVLPEELIFSVAGISSAGYLNPESGQLKPGHLAVFTFLVVVLAVYLFCFIKFRPRVKPGMFQTPTLFFVLVILLVSVLGFGGTAFFFDFYRIPVLFLFLVFFFITYGLFKVDHFYALRDYSGDQPAVEDFEEALNNRLKSQGEERTLVVVCASGGGIQAAGWTAQVLTGLQEEEELGTGFTQAIGLISSASGGSVGTMHYLDRFGDNGYPEKSELGHIFGSATKDSLDATGWGLAYPDLWRVMGWPFLVPRMLDRGTAIETDWKGVMKHPYTALSDWRKQIMEGKIPTPVFNATLVEDGRRFLLSPMSFTTSPTTSTDFNTLYSGYDTDATTAARLSATFPYVTPICRNDKGDKIFHVADGGYFDNYGVFTSVEWLNNIVLPRRRKLGIERVLILVINAFPEPGESQGGSGKSGWLMALAGPLLALNNVRGSTQTARNTEELECLKECWKDQVKIRYYNITFPREIPTADPQDPFTEEEQFADKEGRYSPPLSWKLTKRQKQAIHRAWGKVRTLEAVQGIKNTWKEWHPAQG